VRRLGSASATRVLARILRQAGSRAKNACRLGNAVNDPVDESQANVYVGILPCKSLDSMT